MTNKKVFTSVKVNSQQNNGQRPPLNGYKREFSMPDAFHIDIKTRSGNQNRYLNAKEA